MGILRSQLQCLAFPPALVRTPSMAGNREQGGAAASAEVQAMPQYATAKVVYSQGGYRKAAAILAKLRKSRGVDT